MHIIAIVLAVVGGLAFWWWRMRVASEAASEVVDAVGRVRGAMRRKKIRTQTELSPLTAINDPMVAAATALVALASDDVALSPEREEAIRREIAPLTTPDKVDEAVIYGKWAAKQIDDAQTVIDKLAPFLSSRLYENERRETVAMARAVLDTTGPELPLAEQRIRRLTQKLGLEVR